MPDITVLITSRVKAEIKKSINYETICANFCRNEEDDTSVEQEDYHAVILQRGTKGFGFGICGGKEFHNMPLFVLRIVDNGPAQQDGKIKLWKGAVTPKKVKKL
ncbi:membrane-associated guanylate kinase, WW and PDZ domain-containing protein 1-like isoform X2 [Stegodyphus dumicola]|uniref:membrane-associated guanylate kinase, WW and PDZ domain-containing protein 1-like isoform X2 n=1 Tax=Stegodyphus dumicola TaxID=202533 RepID=UPI0015AA330C|nr:membrane-associated guanylate kinase, WW and PDZ domain-containing protein 1-like isoform X2 [Stegodyphus dumicola]